MTDAESENPFVSPGNSTEVALSAIRCLDPQFPLEGTIKAHGRLTLRQYHEAFRLYHGRYGVITALSSICMILVFLWFMVEQYVSPIFFIIPVAVMVLAFVCRIWQVRHSDRKQWREGKGWFATSTYFFSQERIAAATGEAATILPWDAFDGMNQSDSLVLLRLKNTAAYTVIPSNYFDNETEWEQFLALAKRKLPTR